MNIPQLLHPKCSVAFLYADQSVRQGLEKMRHHGYTAIPVISREGRYMGTVSEGDFLRCLMDQAKDADQLVSIYDMEDKIIGDMLDIDKNLPVNINATSNEVFLRSLEQNFIPVIDDREAFIGIITRKDVLNYFLESAKNSGFLE